MFVKVLGSAAGGGFPQWNCGCFNCRGIRAGSIKATARTQASAALRDEASSWFLLNASPDIRSQIESFAELQPKALRHTPICGILLNNGDLDHCLGVFLLRESQPLRIYATERVYKGLSQNVIYRTLQRSSNQLTWTLLKPGEPQPLLNADGAPTDLVVTAIPVAGKVPLHLEGIVTPDPEDNIGLSIFDASTAQTLCYIPSVGRPTAILQQALAEADCVFFDGTFFSSTEIIDQGLGSKSAEDMAHWPLEGADGSLAFLRELGAARRILTHINNTNPILREDSPERMQVDNAGVEVAYDGLEIRL